MIKTLTLKQAIAQAFDIDGRTIPDFTSSKPVKQARDWLERNGHKFDYTPRVVADGIVVHSFGGGNPVFTVIEGNAAELEHAQIFATLAPIKRGRKSKSQERREKAMQISNEPVESTPVIADAPNDEASTGGTVIEPEDSEK